MAKKKITVRTVKAKNKVEILPDASVPTAEPVAVATKPGLALAQPAAAPQGVVMSDHLQNPFDDDAAVATAPEKYTWQAILMLISTCLVIGIVVIQWLEWNHYYSFQGENGPCFLKTVPSMPAVAPVVPVVAAPVAPAAEDMGLAEVAEVAEEAPADDMISTE